MVLDRDLTSIQQARDLVETAHRAQLALAKLNQEQTDAIVQAMSQAALANADRLAQLAVEETKFGVAADKATKNRFAAKDVYEFFKDVKTVGVVRETETLMEIAAPRGVVAAIIPSTNPTSTAIFKALIAVKSRNAVVMSPHPSAAGCIAETVRVVREAAEASGLPPGAISCLTISTLGGTEALMKHDRTAVILATGGVGLVRAAYGSGKPAFGVGPGNVPVLIDRSADIRKAVADILAGKTFDNGTVCASEQAVVVEEAIDAPTRREFEAQGAYFLDDDAAAKLARLVVLPTRGLNPAIVGRSVQAIAEMAGLSVPSDARALMVKLTGVGRDFPLSIEKLSPILAYYVAPDFKTGSEICAQVLRYGGMGHSVGIHSQDRERIREFGLMQPASRILVNTPTTHGAIGFSTDLTPSMTLGCGSWGGNVTSDNISPLHLLDIKRVAFETFPVTQASTTKPSPRTASPVAPVASPSFALAPQRPSSSPVKPAPLVPERAAIAALVDQFLAERRPAVERALQEAQSPSAPAPVIQPVAAHDEAPPVAPKPEAAKPEPPAAEFVCEDDVRRAIVENRKIPTDRKTIITPAARDLGRERGVFAGYAE
jgi:acetaldehyde dehydrogenase (acetylating)